MAHSILFIRQNYPSQQNPVGSNWVYHQAKQLEGSGYETLVIAPTPYIPGPLRSFRGFRLYPENHSSIRDYKGTRVIRPPFLRFPGMMFYSRTLRNFSRAIGTVPEIGSSELIHAHFGYDGVGALPLKRKLGVPLITTFYGGDVGRWPARFPEMYSELIDEGELFLAISSVMIEDLFRLGFPRDRIRLWHLGVDMDMFRPLERRPDREGFRFVTISTFIEFKGVQYGLRAFKRVHDEYPDCEYHIVGFGPYESELRNITKELDLEEAVTFINNQEFPDPRAVVQDELRQGDALIHATTPSEQAREGTPVILMEAQACGIPCVSTDFAGIPEVVIHDRTGFIVPPFDVDTLADRMIDLMESAPLRERFSIEARKHVQTEFNYDNQVRDLIGIYEDFLE